MMININKNINKQVKSIFAIKVIFSIILLRLILDYVYIFYVAKYFPKEFSFVSIKAFRLSESYILTLILIFFLVYFFWQNSQPSGVIVLLYLLFVILPLLTLYGLSEAPGPFIYASLGSFIFLLLIAKLLPRVRLRQPGIDIFIIGLIIFFVICLYVYGFLILSGGLSRISFDLSSVYQVRAEYSNYRVPLIGYFVPWQANVFNISLFCYALFKKSYWLLGIASVLQLLIFGMTNFKSFLLAPLLAVGIFIFWNRKNKFLYIFLGASMFVLMAYSIFFISSNHMVPSLLIRRLFFVPASNHLKYYDFFSKPQNPFVLLSNSVLAPFIDYPYDMPITRVISWEYWDRDFGPNVGFLGDAYAQFGFFGMFLFSFILGLFMRILDSVGGKLDNHLVAAMIAVPAMALVNSALFTTLLTHGFISALFVIWMFRRISRKEGIKN